MPPHRARKSTLTAKRGQLPLLLIAGVGLVGLGLISQLMYLCGVGALLLVAAAAVFYNHRQAPGAIAQGRFDQRAAERFGPVPAGQPGQPPAGVYWDGYQWVQPLQPAQADQVAAISGVLGLALAVIGSAMQLSSVSLLTGDSIYWIGAALAVVGAVLAWVKSGKAWVGVVCLILAALCVANVVYTERQFSERRQEISSTFGS
jgi:hypothetical protein